MYRIFLVIDDYNELTYLQTLLRKLSLDVEGIQNQKKFDNIKLGFNPQMIIATAQGKNVNGLEIANGLRKNNGHPALILLRSVTQTYDQAAFNLPQIDEVLETPVNVHKLLACISQFSGQDIDLLMDKYSKIKGADITPQEEDQIVNVHESNKSTPDDPQQTKNKKSYGEEESIIKISSSLPDSDRVEKFKNYLSKMEPLEEVPFFARDKVVAHNKKIRKEEKPPDNDELETSRQDFVKALFQKKGSA